MACIALYPFSLNRSENGLPDFMKKGNTHLEILKERGVRKGMIGAALVPLFYLPGCGTIAGLQDPEYSKVLAGTRADLQAFSSQGPYIQTYLSKPAPGGGGPGGPDFGGNLGRNISRNIWIYLWLPFDLPLSLGLDVALFPVTVTVDGFNALASPSPPASNEEP